MLRSLKRLQLQRRGLATSRRRRKQGESEIRQLLEHNPFIKALIFLGFYAGLVGLIYSADVGHIYGQDALKASVVGGLIFIAAFVQFYANHAVSYGHNGRTLLMFGAVLLQVSLVRLCGIVVDLLPALSQTPETSRHFLFLLIPYALAPMALSVLLGRRQAVFATIFSAIFGCLIVEQALLFDFLLGSLMAGIVAVYATHDLRKRGRLMRAGCYVGLISLTLALMLGHIPFASDISAMGPRTIGVQVLTVLLVGIITAGIVGGFLPMLETLFGITTNISWLELADLNHKLLKRMTIEAPGTYHHSLVVARLAEGAAESIGASAIQCQVCSYFHDIGKLVKPGYFIENINSEDNPHDDLSPSMSVLVIHSHVKEGVDLALKHKLKLPIIDVIQEHHGTSLVYYFYRRALDKQEAVRKLVEEGKAREEDIPEVNEEDFRYSGPIPQTKESAIISLADSVESASRSLEKPTHSKIEQLVETMVAMRMKDGQLDDCDLTMRELAQIKDSFTKTLISMLHTRISYPKAAKAEDDDTTPPKNGNANKRLRVIDAA